jgi:hypothetical protein
MASTNEISHACAVCDMPADTVVYLEGRRHEVGRNLLRLGLIEIQAESLIRQLGEWSGDNLEVVTVPLRVCAECAARDGMTPGLALPGANTPVYAAIS